MIFGIAIGVILAVYTTSARSKGGKRGLHREVGPLGVFFMGIL